MIRFYSELLLNVLMPFCKRVPYSILYDKFRLLFAHKRIQLHNTKTILMACIELFSALKIWGTFTNAHSFDDIKLDIYGLL